MVNKPWELTANEMTCKWECDSCSSADCIAHAAQKKLLEYLEQKVFYMDRRGYIALKPQATNNWQSLLKEFNTSNDLDKIKECDWPWHSPPPYAQICPVCGGKGQVNNVHPTEICMERWETCHGCGGIGWVTAR